MNNPFKFFFYLIIQKNDDRRGEVKIIFLDNLRRINCIDLLKGYSGFFLNLTIDGFLLFAADTILLIKTQYLE